MVKGYYDDLGRECSHCKQYLPWSRFTPHSRGFMGRQPRCRECCRVLGKYRQAWRYSNLIISEVEYDDLLAQQDGVCAICKQPETVMRAGRVKRLAVDHCHETSRVRGLLCNRCNTALGLMRDSAERLMAAAAYVS